MDAPCGGRGGETSASEERQTEATIRTATQLAMMYGIRMTRALRCVRVTQWLRFEGQMRRTERRVPHIRVTALSLQNC